MVADAADSRAACILMILLPARPSRPNVMSIAQCPQERLRATQAAGELAGIFGPAGTVPRMPSLLVTGAGPQEVGAASDDPDLVVPKAASSTAVACTVERRCALHVERPPH
jgi:hypothetical protein